uniref:Mucin n=1 Tax=Rhipicephalus zambeziensis TaxID=60191 RepID=A0A224YD41_9ACAR
MYRGSKLNSIHSASSDSGSKSPQKVTMFQYWSRKFCLLALCAILCATLAAAENDLYQGPDQGQGPVQSHGFSDKDCSYHQNQNGTEEEHVYEKCAFVCDTDEAFAVSDDKKCWMPSTTTAEESPTSVAGSEGRVQGICKNGECVSSK